MAGLSMVVMACSTNNLVKLKHISAIFHHFLKAISWLLLSARPFSKRTTSVGLSKYLLVHAKDENTCIFMFRIIVQV